MCISIATVVSVKNNLFIACAPWQRTTAYTHIVHIVFSFDHMFDVSHSIADLMPRKINERSFCVLIIISLLDELLDDY